MILWIKGDSFPLNTTDRQTQNLSCSTAQLSCSSYYVRTCIKLPPYLSNDCFRIFTTKQSTFPHSTFFPFPSLYLPTKPPSTEGRAGTARNSWEWKTFKHFTSVTSAPSPNIPSNFSGFFLFFSGLRRVVTIKPKIAGNSFTEKRDDHNPAG